MFRFRISIGTGGGGQKKDNMSYGVKTALVQMGSPKKAKMLHGVKFGPVLHQKNA